MQNGVIIKFLVERLDTPQRPIVATVYDPEAWVIDQFAAIYQFYLENGNSLDGRISIILASSSVGGTSKRVVVNNENDKVNSYDIVESSIDRNRLADVLAADPKLIFTSVMSSFGRVVRLEGLATPEIALTVTVELFDRSTVVYKFNYDTKKWEYVADSAKDSNNNSVPESRDDFVNGEVGSAEFDFRGGNGNDFEDFVRRASAYGIRIVGGRGIVTCVSVGGSISCEVQ